MNIILPILALNQANKQFFEKLQWTKICPYENLDRTRLKTLCTCDVTGSTLADVMGAAILSHWYFPPRVLVVFFRFPGEEGA